MTLADLLRQPRHHKDHVFNDAVIHIGDVERAVGADAGINGTKAFVGRGEEFLLGRIEPGCTRLDTAAEFQASDEVAAGFGDKDVAARVGGKLVAVRRNTNR